MRRFLSWTLALCLSLTLFVGSAAAEWEPLAESGQYWTQLKSGQATDLFAAVMDGTAEPFLFVYYARDCGYSKSMIPQFYEYAEKNQIAIYGMDQVVNLGEPTDSLRFGFNFGGGFPIVLRYSGYGKSVETYGSIRTMEAFEDLVVKKTTPQGDFVITDGALTAYLGSSVDVTVPDGVTTIAHHCFAENTTLRSITLPEGVTTIEQYAFDGCTSLANINFPSTLRTFEYMAFNDCSALTGPLVIPEGVTELPFGLFTDCTSLRAVSLPDSLITIGNGVFFQCNALKELTFGSNLQTLGDDALYDCLRLIELTFPPSLKKLGNGSLVGCSNVQTIYFLGPKPSMQADKFHSPFSVTNTSAIIYPKDDPSWGTPESLKAEFPYPNWGGQPGYRLPVPPRSQVDDGTLADWACDEVLHAVALELTPESPLFRFDMPITRIDFCEMMMNLIQKRTGVSAFTLGGSVPRETFTDAPSVYARGAYALGLASGKGDGIFDPYGSITREEAAAMLTRTARYLNAVEGGTPLTFSDRESCAAWALEGIDFVSTLKSPVSGKAVMGSTSGGAFSPTATYSLQEAACSFLRLYQLISAA